MPKPIGSVVSLYYDTPHEVAEGHYLQTSTGRCYEVLECRVQKGIHEAYRKRIRALVVDKASMKPSSLVHQFFWYERK